MIGGEGQDRDDRSLLRRVPVADRPDKVDPGDFAAPPEAGGSFRAFLDSLPHILQADAFRAVASGIAGAVRSNRTCLWMLGGHRLHPDQNPMTNPGGAPPNSTNH